MKKITVTQLTKGAVVAAIYTVLTVVAAPISFGPLQFRISEALTVLPFIMPEAVWGLTIGCLVSNLLGSTFIDAVFGTVATLLAAWVTTKIRHMWLAPLPAIIFNGIIVGATVTIMSVEFTLTSYLMIALSISVSELIICYCAGIPLLAAVNKLLSGKSSLLKFKKKG